MIDARAIIDPQARLAEGVAVGPFSVIGPDVQIDEGCWIGPHVVIKGPCQIGKNNKIFQFSSIGEDPQDKKYAGEVTDLAIGDGNTIREFCTIHRGTQHGISRTRIGNHNLFMAYTHVAHDCVIGDSVIMANGASLAGHVYLADHVILGGFTLVHQFCRIGQYSFSAMGCAITRDIPPYVMVGGQPTKPYGINSVGLDREGFKTEIIRDIRKAYKILYKSGLMLDEATDLIREMTAERPELSCVIEFLNDSNRGILR